MARTDLSVRAIYFFRDPHILPFNAGRIDGEDLSVFKAYSGVSISGRRRGDAESLSRIYSKICPPCRICTSVVDGGPCISVVLEMVFKIALGVLRYFSRTDDCCDG